MQAKTKIYLKRVFSFFWPNSVWLTNIKEFICLDRWQRRLISNVSIVAFFVCSFQNVSFEWREKKECFDNAQHWISLLDVVIWIFRSNLKFRFGHIWCNPESEHIFQCMKNVEQKSKCQWIMRRNCLPADNITWAPYFEMPSDRSTGCYLSTGIPFILVAWMLQRQTVPHIVLYKCDLGSSNGLMDFGPND